MPNNAVLAVFGDIDPEAMAEKVKSAFGKWRPGKLAAPVIPKAVAPLTATEQVRKKTEKRIPKKNNPSSRIKPAEEGYTLPN